MTISELYKHKKIISFEIFPPKTEKGLTNLWNELAILAKFNPGFISVTYGAGGSTRDKTLDIAINIKNKLNITPLVHFTCVGLDRTEITSYLDSISHNGISNILALRGDPPHGDTSFIAPEDGFTYASELINYIKTNNHFSIVVAGYPEGHTESPNLDSDIDNLKKKIDAGGEIIITQLFFHNECFYNYMNKLEQKNIKVPVIPGIMPITNKRQLDKIRNTFGASIEGSLLTNLENLENDSDIIKVGIEHSSTQCQELLSWGIPGIHFYPLNKSHATTEVINNLKLSE